MCSVEVCSVEVCSVVCRDGSVEVCSVYSFCKFIAS